MNNTEIGIIILQIIIISLIFIFKNTIPFYLKEKAKNIATKQDVGKITSEIEHIKSEFNSNLAVLKSNLSHNKQSTFSIDEKKRMMIIDYLETYNYWLFSIVHFDFLGYNIENIGNIKEHRVMLKNYRIKFSVLDNNLYLFYKNDEFNRNKIELIKHTIELEKKLDITTRLFESKMSELNSLNSIEIDKRLNLKKQIEKELITITDNYYKVELPIIYKEIADSNVKFTVFLKAELRKGDLSLKTTPNNG